MSWEGELIHLYDINSSRAGMIDYKYITRNGKEERIPYVLLPPFHTTVTAQIELMLSKEGDFLGASRVRGEEKLTIIPITEKSGSRTAGKAPHPLCDNLRYLAGDYGSYVKDEKGDLETYHTMYMEQLKKWHESEFSHEKVDAVYKYLEKGTLMGDLIREKVLALDDSGRLAEDVKIEGVDQDIAFVRFIVRGNMGTGFEELCDECWMDQTLQECFIQYCRAVEGEKSLDYLTGEIQAPSYLHSKKIRNEGDGAKLISSNDEANYTFRGRSEEHNV